MDEKLQDIQQRILVLVGLVFLTGGFLFPTFLVSYGIMGTIEDSGFKLTEKFKIYKVIFGVLLLVGSIIGLLIGVFVPKRPIALAVVVLVNWVVVIIMSTQIESSMEITSILLLIFGVTVGLMGPILVLFITDQYTTKQKAFNDAFIYMIGCCSLVTSIYPLYTRNLYNNPKSLLNISIGCFVIPFVVLLLIIALHLFTSKDYFIVKPAPKNVVGSLKSIPLAEVSRLIGRNVSAALLFIFVNQLENSAYTWINNVSEFNAIVKAIQFQEPVMNQTRVNASDWFQDGFIVIYLAPLFILFGLESYPICYFMVACFSILLAAWLWPFLQKCCIPTEDHRQFIDPENATIISYPSPCAVKPPIVNIIFCLIIFGKLMLVTSILIISCRNLESDQIFVAVAVYFCFLYTAYITATALSKNYLNDDNTMMLILFIIMLLNIYINLYARNVAAARVPEQNNDSKMDEVKVIKKIPPAAKPQDKAKPEPQKQQPPEEKPPEQKPPEQQPAEEIPAKKTQAQSVSSKRASRTAIPVKSKSDPNKNE